MFDKDANGPPPRPGLLGPAPIASVLVGGAYPDGGSTLMGEDYVQATLEGDSENSATVAGGPPSIRTLRQSHRPVASLFTPGHDLGPDHDCRTADLLNDGLRYGVTAP